MAQIYPNLESIYNAVVEKTNRGAGLSPTLPNTNIEVTGILSSINQACSLIFNKYEFKQLSKTVTVNLISNQETYDFSEAPYNLPYWKADRLGVPGFKENNLDLPISAVLKSELYKYYRVNRVTSSIPTMWYIGEGNTVGFYPKPSIAVPIEMIYTPSYYVTDNLNVPKSKATALNDIILIPEEFENYLIYQACYIARLNTSANEKMSFYKDMIAQYEKNFISSQRRNTYPTTSIQNLKSSSSRNYLYRQGSRWI
jgi:hypothetical protein